MKKIILLLVIFLTFASSAGAENWLTDIEAAKRMALSTNKLILVDFWATWCGPCKKMDYESWSKEDVMTLMSNYIPLKIDIDLNKPIARRYGVKAIPYIFILDANGKVIYKSMSYMPKQKVMELLESYSLTTQYLNKELLNYYQKSNFITSYRLAAKYHDFAFYLDRDKRKGFLRASETYFDEAFKFLKENDMSNKKVFEQKIKLYEVQKELLENNPKRASRLLEKIKENGIHEMNESFFNYLIYASYKLLDDESNVSLWDSKVSSKDKKKVELMMQA